MTENEAKAIKWMENVREDAVVTLDNIKKNEPNVSPMLYAGRKEKAETIIKGFEELELYRSIGTVEECQETMEKSVAKKPDMTEDKQFALCPSCNGKGLFSNQKYCDNCGQKIDWENY